MTVLQVVAPGAVGGLERVVQMLSRGLHDRGHRVLVAAIGSSTSVTEPFAAPLEAAGVTVIRTVVAPRHYLQERAAVGEICQTHEPNVVHTHGYRPDILGASAARRQRTATVTTVHGYTGGDWKNRLYERLQRRALRRFDAVVAVSEPLHRSLRQHGIPEERLDLIPNAWDDEVEFADRRAARAVLGLPDDLPVIGWVGRLSTEKAADVLIEATRHLSDMPHIVSIIGSGSQEAALRERASELGYEDSIRFHGTMADAATLYHAFDCLVLSSRTEGTPIVLFEAMAGGVPIVATRVGGVPDVVGESEALLVAPDDPEALAGAIRHALSDEDGARRRAANARERLSSTFEADSWVRAYEDVYARVTAEQGPQGDR